MARSKDGKNPFVTIRRLTDAVEGGMMVELLKQEGIRAHAPGLEHAGMMGGLLTVALDIPLRVPKADARRAKALLAALDDYESIDDDDESAEEESEDDLPERDLSEDDLPERGIVMPERLQRSPGAVVGVALILPFVLGAFGAAHFYTRNYPIGFLLLLFGWSALVLGFMGYDVAFFGIPLAIAIDAWGALRSLRVPR